MAAVVERVDRLEEALQGFITSVGIEFNKLYNSQMRTEAEMRAFKDEIAAFKDEMSDFKDEMRDFKNGVSDFKDEVRQQNREMNRKWGDVSNKLGTMVEDLVAPSLPRIIEEKLSQTVLDIMSRRKRRLADGRIREDELMEIKNEPDFEPKRW